MNKSPIIIIGAGPAGLMAAQALAEKGYRVDIYDQNKAPARKFLVAGNGGFNLTHNEDIEQFIQKYDAFEIREIVRKFDNQQVVKWLRDLGISTYVGSSGKVFPTKEIKPVQVLKAWLKRLENLGVNIYLNQRLVDFNKEEVIIESAEGQNSVRYSHLIFGMGGGSWRKTGSDAKWVEIFSQKNIKINPLQPANSGYHTAEVFSGLEGRFLKNIKISFNDHHKIGELVFTHYGIEGAAVYFMNRWTRSLEFPQYLYLDLKPQWSVFEIFEHLNSDRNINAVLKKKLKLSATAIQLLKTLNKETYTDKEKLADIIKKFPLEITEFRPLDEVISTAGGVAFSELKSNLELKNFPNVFCVGEMLDWEAPTGGYLLQACFSSGQWVAQSIINQKVL